VRRYILTGTPGSGKTTLIDALQVRGHAVVREAATDVNAEMIRAGIAEPWRHRDFIDRIVSLQRAREEACADGGTVFFDRAPICTLALSRYIGREPSAALLSELHRVRHCNIYARRVLFIENIGFCEPTGIRRISFEDSLRFEAIHRDVYVECGFECVPIPKMDVGRRVEKILEEL
jgi:predicted ATPase